MTTLSPNQIAYYAYQAGFRGDALRMAVAIALAESSGNTNAYNPEIAAGTRSGSGSRGLWQIYGAAHPEYNSSLVFDPLANARAAFAVYSQAGNRFTPWSTYNNGSAKQYYSQLGSLFVSSQPVQPVAQQTAIQGIPATTATSGGGTNPNVLTQAVSSGITQAAQSATSGIDFQKIGQDFGFVFGGGLLVMIGLFALFYSGAQAIGKSEIGGEIIRQAPKALAAL